MKILLPLAVAILLIGAAFTNLRLTPDLSALSDVSPVVLASDGQIIHLRLNSTGKWRQSVRLEDLDPKLVATLLAFEDRRFYRHAGVDVLALIRAFKDLVVTGRRVSGGSTITMQLARLLDPDLQKRSVPAKMKQIWSALRLDAHLSKQKILEAYFTLAPYGGNIEGVVAASEAWLQKPPMSLTESEVAFLVAMPQSPESRRPDRRLSNAISAKNHVLKAVAEERGYSHELLNDYLEESLPLQKTEVVRTAPHLMDRLSEDGVASVASETAIDPIWQATLTQMVNEYVDRFPVPINGAAMAVERKTGLVRAYVGSSSYSDAARKGGNNFLTSRRSPGSILKPLIYAMALDKGKLTPNHIFSDRTYQRGGYSPTNFDGGFSGDVTLQEALVTSLNIPAIQTLQRIGPQQAENALRNFLNYTSAGVKFAGLSLAVGGMYLTGEDIVRLYLSFADPVESPRLAFVESKAEQVPNSLISAEASASIQSLLAVPLISGGVRVAKTGTSQNQQDAHTILLTRDHIIYAWLGTPDNEATDDLTGATVALPLAERIQLALGLPPAALRPARDKTSRLSPDLTRNCSDVFIYPKDEEWLRVETLAFEIKVKDKAAKFYLNGHKVVPKAGIVSVPTPGAYTLSARTSKCSQTVKIYVDQPQ